jgi:Tol biopolymer transport system component
MNGDGSGQRSAGAAVDGFPVWSPDGRLIAFSTRDRRARVYVAEPGGAHPRVLTPARAFDCLWMAWSPNGRKLAYTRNAGCEGEMAIFVVNRDGSGRRRLTPGSGSYDGVWSPRGRELLYASYRSGNTARLFVMRADGTGKRPVPGARLPRPLGVPTRPEAAWSRDGKRIFFIGNTSLGGTALFVTKVNGTHRRNLTPGLDTILSFTLSSNGRKIAVSASLNGSRDIYVLAAGGGGLHNLTNGSGRFVSTDPQWFPSGKKLAFSGYGQTRPGKSEIYVIDADGRNLRNISRSPAVDVAATWQPG